MKVIIKIHEGESAVTTEILWILTVTRVCKNFLEGVEINAALTSTYCLPNLQLTTLLKGADTVVLVS